jgi:hypothetical protein
MHNSGAFYNSFLALSRAYRSDSISKKQHKKWRGFCVPEDILNTKNQEGTIRETMKEQFKKSEAPVMY